ncbi:MAG: DUF368 domain-containing protein [Oscillospiraceae bacterium]|nr:DUF368 domain-containing protein [Oscillospiraceae bacterium]
MKIFLYRVFCGSFLTLCALAPGFSGSVMAIILGVYRDLLHVISNPFKNFKKNLKFIFPMCIGAVICAVLFVFSFKFLFDTYEKAIYLLFAGLIAGNLPIIYSEIKKCGFQRRYLLGGTAAFAVALTFGVLAAGVSASGEFAISLPMMALGGVVTGVALLAPGMSVATILIYMGIYSQLITMADSLLRMDSAYLFPFGLFLACALAGVIFTSKGVKTLFERFPGFTNSMVFGFMAGSMLGVITLSLRLESYNFNWFIGGFMLFAGVVVSLLLVMLGKVINR